MVAGGRTEAYPLAEHDGLDAVTSGHADAGSHAASPLPPGGGGGGGGGGGLLHATRAEADTAASSSTQQRAAAVDAELERRRERAETKEHNDTKRNGVLSMCFFFVTLQSIYTGAHVIAPDGFTHLEKQCLVAVVVCMNVEFLLLKYLVDVLTRDEGVLLPAVHEHVLYFSKAEYASCMVCRQRLGTRTGGPEGFRCLDCERFWICLLCYRKQESKVDTSEGILRGDKGPKPAPELNAWQYLRRGLKLVWPFRYTMAAALLCVVLTQIAKVLMPKYRGTVINALVDDDRQVFGHELSVFVALSVFSSILGSAQSLTTSLVQRFVQCDTRTAMFESLIKQDIAFYDGTMTGQLTSRMTNDVASVVQPVQSFLNQFLAALLRFSGGCIMCFFTSWQLTVLAATMIGPVIYLTKLYAQWSKKLQMKIQVNRAEANAVATEAIRNIRTVRSFAADQVELTQFRSHTDKALGYATKQAYSGAAVNAITGYLNYAATVLILWFGGMSVLRQGGAASAELTIGQLITFNLYWDMLNASIQSMNGVLNSLVQAASAAQRVFEIIDLEPDISMQEGEPIPPGPYSVEFRGIEFTYQMRPEKQVLKGLNFTIEPGHIVAVVGKSGAGKSTLVSLLLRFYDPQAGDIWLNGKPLTEWRLRDHQHRVGVVSQETQVFNRPVIDNLTYGMPASQVSEEKVVEAARMANAHDFIEEMDLGYKSLIGEGGGRLSGGQRQRLSIARALLRCPSLLLLDEATSALDAENEGQVQQALDKLVSSMAGRCSVVLIAHRLSTVMNADKIVVLDGGVVIEEGTHTELLQQAGTYAQLVERQLSAQANVLSEDAAVEATDAAKGKGKGKRGKKGKGKAEAQGAKRSAADSIDRLFEEAGCGGAASPQRAAGNSNGAGAGAASSSSPTSPSSTDAPPTPRRGAREAPPARKFSKKLILICTGGLLTLLGDAICSLLLAARGLPVYLVLCLLRSILLVAGGGLSIYFGNGGWVRGSAPGATSAEASPSLTSGSASIMLQEELRQRRLAAEARERGKWKRNLVLCACFVAVTSQSTFTGTHVVNDASTDSVRIRSLVALIGFINLQFLLVKRVVDDMTQDAGVLLPGIHEHKLYFNANAHGVFCRICRERIGPKTGGNEGFRCSACDGGFWVCIPCYQKREGRATAADEGLLRSDKGAKPPLELTALQYFRRGLKLMERFRWLLVLALLSVLLAQVANVLLPYHRGSVLDALVAGHEAPTSEAKAKFADALRVFVLLTVSASFFGAVQGLSSTLVQRNVSFDTRVDMFASMIKQDIAFFDGAMTGQLTSRMTNDVVAIVQPVQQVLNNFLGNSLRFAGGAFMCFQTSWKLTVLSCTLVGPVIYITRLYAIWSKGIQTQIRTKMADAVAVATEAMKNIRTVRSFGAEEYELEQFRTHMDDVSRNARKDAIASAGVSAITGYLEFSTAVLILWYGGLAVLDSRSGSAQGGGSMPELRIGALITYNLYWDMMTNSIQSLNGMLNLLIRAASAAQRVFEVMDLKPDISLEGGRVMERGEAYSVEFREVQFTYQMRPEKQVLAGLSFTIAPGQTVAAVGRSGAGKSTLVSLLLRFYDPQGGAVLLNGSPLQDWGLREHQKRVGVVSQETQVFCRPVIDNLTYGLLPHEYTESDVIDAARMANAHEFIEDMDMGYRSMIGEGGNRLSGGQKQRLAIARALLRKPSLLLLDEATSALDAENEGQVQKALDKLVNSMAGKCSVLLIAHRLSTVMGADKIVVIDKGRVVEQGTHSELLEAGAIYAQLVNRQLSAQANRIEQD